MITNRTLSIGSEFPCLSYALNDITKPGLRESKSWAASPNSVEMPPKDLFTGDIYPEGMGDFAIPRHGNRPNFFPTVWPATQPLKVLFFAQELRPAPKVGWAAAEHRPGKGFGMVPYRSRM